MTEINYSSLLREIAVDYFEHRLTRVEYLAQRRGVLDRIDHEFNGEDETTLWPEPDITDDDITQPNPIGYSGSYHDGTVDTDDNHEQDHTEPSDSP